MDVSRHQAEIEEQRSWYEQHGLKVVILDSFGAITTGMRVRFKRSFSLGPSEGEVAFIVGFEGNGRPAQVSIETSRDRYVTVDVSDVDPLSP